MIVTTAVFRFLSEPIAAEFGIADVIATEAERLDGRYTGRVSGVPNAREGKFERLQMFLAARGQQLTDFRHDLRVLRFAERPAAALAGVEPGRGQCRPGAVRARAAHGLAGAADRMSDERRRAAQALRDSASLGAASASGRRAIGQ